MANTGKIPTQTGRGMMPPAGVSSTDVALARIQALVETISERAMEERAEAKERGQKMDTMIERMGLLDTKVNAVARDLADKLADQNRASHDLDIRFTRSLDETKRSLTSALELISLNVKKLETIQESTTMKVGLLSERTENMLSDQNKLRVEVAEVKTDTTRLQTSIAPIDAIRTRTLALWAILLSVGGVAAVAVFQGMGSSLAVALMHVFSHSP